MMGREDEFLLVENLWIPVCFKLKRFPTNQRKIVITKKKNTYLLWRVDWETDTDDELDAAFEERPVNKGATLEAVDNLALPRIFDANNWPFWGEFGDEQNGEERTELPVELGNPKTAAVEVSIPRIFVCIIRCS